MLCKELALPGAHASVRAERSAFKKPRRKFKLNMDNLWYAAKRDLARRDACAPGDESLLFR